MKKKPHATLSDVARNAGVGTTTVSRVINGGDRVSPETLKSVHRAIKELGFVPNPAARILKGEQSKTIGLIIPNLADSYFSSIAEEIQTVARSFGSMVIVTVSHNDVEREWQSIYELRRRIDGLLLAPASSNNPELVERLAALPLPVVCFDRPLCDSDIPSVLTDNYQCAKAMTEHLLRHNYQRILCLGGEASFHTLSERLRGYLAAMRQARRTAIVDVSKHKRDAGEVAHVLAQRFKSTNPPDAIFCLKNSTTIDSYDFLQSFEITIPTRAALAGFDDFRLAATLRPSITVVRQPVQEIGQAAAKLLFERLAGGKHALPGAGAAGFLRLKNTLVVRASCGCDEVPGQSLDSSAL
jgi:LacI family transcriptional regulator